MKPVAESLRCMAGQETSPGHQMEWNEAGGLQPQVVCAAKWRTIVRNAGYI